MSLDLLSFDEVAQLRQHFLLLNGSPEAISVLLDPAITPASLTAWLASDGKPALFEQLMAAPAAVGAVAANVKTMAAVAASSTAMAAVAASSTAMAAVAASSTAMATVAASNVAMSAVIDSSTALAAVAASSTAMAAVAASNVAMSAVIASSTALAAVAASSTAMAAVAASSTALMAVHGQDTALNAIKGSAVAMAAMRASPKYITTAGASYSGGVGIAAFNPAGTYILLGISSNNVAAGQSISLSTKRAGSTVTNTGLTVSVKAADAKTLNLAIPLVTPFLANADNAYTWFLGAIRCDV